MKRFIRTIAGKTIIFIACILSLCIFAGSVLGIILMTADSDYNFYTQSEQELKEQVIGGNLRSQAYSFLWDAAYRDANPVPVTDNNYIFEVLDENDKSLYHSADAGDLSQWQYSFIFEVFKNSNNKVTHFYFYDANTPTVKNAEYYTVNMSLKEGSQDANEYALITQVIHIAYSLRYAVYAIGIAALLVAIICFITLMCVSGRKPNTEEICPGPLNKVPFDFLLTVCAVCAIGAIYLCDAICTHDGVILVIFVIGLAIAGASVLLGLCMSIAARIKLHTLISNTVIYRCVKLAWKIICRFWTLLKKLHKFNMSIIHSFPIIWKTGAAVIGLSFLEFILIVSAYDEPDVLLSFFFLEKLILIPSVLYLAVCLRKLQKGGIALAGGDLSFVTDTKGMFWDLKQHGENLNSIAVGMSIAVEDRMKSERMKTELITNVSHDIKTPLTSIINYAALIGNEPSENTKITEYSEVLVRQSERLKRLIEDLIEASKASTGNLDVNLAPCDATVFLTQAAGEYEKKLQQAELTLITKQPDKELRILADGRRMWRIFDNLMNNICKYAQNGTRVYLSLEQIGSNAVITFKNTSRDPLDMTEEDLMERFTRGDSARNTEGNGLGLSIAKSMAELQKGTLRLSIDGDLFKAILTFPII